MAPDPFPTFRKLVAEGVIPERELRGVLAVMGEIATEERCPSAGGLRLNAVGCGRSPRYVGERAGVDRGRVLAGVEDDTGGLLG